MPDVYMSGSAPAQTSGIARVETPKYILRFVQSSLQARILDNCMTDLLYFIPVKYVASGLSMRPTH